MGTPNHNDDWDDLKTNGAAGKVLKFGTVTASTVTIINNDWIGHDDVYDYRQFTLNSAAKLSLTVTSINSNSVKFGIYQLVEKTDKNGKTTYSLKQLQTVTPKLDKSTGKYTVDTAGLLLEKGTYYIGVQATKPKSTAADTGYTVSLNKGGSVFYTKGVNTDDWDDLKDKGAAGKVAKIATAVTASSAQIVGDWVGYGDEWDYKEFTLNSAANLSFTVSATDAVKFAVYSLQSKTDKNGKTTYSLKQLQTVTPKLDKATGKYVVNTNNLLLDKGKYYIGVQSTNAKKGGSADYTVSLNKTASEFYSSVVAVSASTATIISDWVGHDDEWDCQAITLNSAAKLSLSVNSTDAVKITVCALEDKGSSYSFKALQTVTPKLNKATGKYVIDTNALLLKKGTYYIRVQSTNAKKAGTKATYTIALNKTASVFFTKGVNTDDWDDLKDKGAAGKVAKIATAVTASSAQIVGDWVGYGDEWDYKEFTLNSAAKLSFTVSATDAVKFVVYSLQSKTDKNGKTTYSLKALQTVTPKLDKTTGKYTVNTAGLLLEKGKYYIGVQSTNANKGGNADYTIALNKGGSVFYTKGVNTDDWDDLKEKGAAGKVAKIATAVTASSAQIFGDWVGYGDEWDYKEFTLNSAANLSFTVSATDAVKFAVYSLQSKTDKNGKTTYSLKQLQTVTPKLDKATGKYVVNTKSLLLDKGKYYIGVQSTNAKKGGSADYTVSLNKSASEFFTKGSDNDNNWDAAPVLKGTLGGDFGMELNGTFTGWVGYGDPVDYRTFTTNAANGGGGYYVFDLGLTNGSKNSLNFTLYEVVDNNGDKSLKKMKSATATTERNGVIGVEKNPLMLKPNTKYVVGVEAPGAKQAKNSSYELAVYQDAFAHFNMANNEPIKATVLHANNTSQDIFNTLTKAAGGDSVDWYNISEFNGKYWGVEITNAFESVSLKLTFYTSSMVEAKVWLLDYSNNSLSHTSSEKLNTKYGVYCDFSLNSDLKYLKIEAASTARNSYHLAVC